MMPNPNEVERIRQEELLDRRTDLINMLSHYRTKTAKENALREIRKIEDDLGIVGLPYNDNSSCNCR